jgi:hypothetical protein
LVGETDVAKLANQSDPVFQGYPLFIATPQTSYAVQFQDPKNVMVDEDQLRSLYERMSDDNSQTDDPIEAALLAEKNKEADYPSSVHVSQTSFQHKFAEGTDQLGIDVAVKSSNTQNKTNEGGPKTQELNSLASKIAKQATKTLEQQNGMFDAKSKAEEKNLS